MPPPGSGGPALRAKKALLFGLAIILFGCQPQIEGASSAIEASEAPELGASDEGAAETGGSLGEEEAVTVAEATPPGLRVVNIKISPTTLGIIQSTGFSGFRSGDSSALVQLPLYGIDPRLGTYYLVVAVGNFGSEPVRNLKARADFTDGRGTRVWSETQPVTHFPTRLGLNPPSLPNTLEAQPPYSGELEGFGLYYFPTNVGVFTYSVPDSTISATIKNWKLTFLVSQS